MYGLSFAAGKDGDVGRKKRHRRIGQYLSHPMFVDGGWIQNNYLAASLFIKSIGMLDIRHGRYNNERGVHE